MVSEDKLEGTMRSRLGRKHVKAKAGSRLISYNNTPYKCNIQILLFSFASKH